MKRIFANPAKVSFGCAITPYILYGLCYVISGDSLGNGDILVNSGFDSVIWGWFLAYLMIFGLWVWIASIAFGVKGLVTKDKVYSYLGLGISILLIIIVLYG